MEQRRLNVEMASLKAGDLGPSWQTIPPHLGQGPEPWRVHLACYRRCVDTPIQTGMVACPVTCRSSI